MYIQNQLNMCIYIYIYIYTFAAPTSGRSFGVRRSSRRPILYRVYTVILFHIACIYVYNIIYIYIYIVAGVLGTQPGMAGLSSRK